MTELPDNLSDETARADGASGADGAAAPTPEELLRCAKTLEALVADRGLLTQLPEEQRRALLMAAGRVSRPMSKDERKLRKAFRRSDKKKRRTNDKQALASTEIRQARVAAVFEAPRQKALPFERRFDERELIRPRNCYVCKKEFNKLHFFYDSMCNACAAFNYEKRYQSADLRGRVAYITGARLKIGYQAALMLLRAGATVLVSTRFPRDAALRYAREEDFGAWRDRIHVFGLDLRHSPSVEIFCRYLNHWLTRLDIVINNAAQTVRRPVGFYQHLLEQEALPHAALPPEIQPLLSRWEELKALLRGEHATANPAAKTVRRSPVELEGPASGGAAAMEAFSLQNHDTRAASGAGIHASAALSQVKYTYDDHECGLDVFPGGKLDADLQQVDLRAMNSWRMTLADVPTPELLEVQLVNAIAPFVICSKLKPLLLRSPAADRYVVNVTAMEGIFSRGTKTDKHPHTNMAKAALNMMTLTSARDYAEDGIYMTAVDTGWVTDEDPAHISARKQDEHDFQPPLDIVDGAARLVDPVFQGVNGGEFIWGKFLKDFLPANW
jgi:NAD(P)-dependent dehydrogenase (short-subunit alcohol dehydrogenase family)